MFFRRLTLPFGGAKVLGGKQERTLNCETLAQVWAFTKSVRIPRLLI